MRTRFLLPLVFLLAACTAQGDPNAPLSSVPGDEPVLVIADGAPGDGAGISVAEALTHGPTDDLVTVTGALFIDADGSVRLCDAIAESFPPQCGGERIVVEGLDLDDIDDIQEEGNVRWSESVTLFGSVE
jgi:hypothetical protein